MSALSHAQEDGGAFHRRHPSPLAGGRKLLYGFLVAVFSVIALLLLSTVGVASANAAANTGTGKVHASASCAGTGTTYTVNVSVTHVISAVPANNDPTTGYARVGVEVKDLSGNNLSEVEGTDTSGDATFQPFTFDSKGAGSVQLHVAGNRVGSGVDLYFTLKFPSCNTPPPPTVINQIQPPTATTPDCTVPGYTETVTPTAQAGVVWNPSGSTVLKPGDSVTYTASPAAGWVFKAGIQTVFPFTNNFDQSKCSSTPPSTTPPTSPSNGGGSSSSAPGGGSSSSGSTGGGSGSTHGSGSSGSGSHSSSGNGSGGNNGGTSAVSSAVGAPVGETSDSNSSGSGLIAGLCALVLIVGALGIRLVRRRGRFQA